MRATKHFNSKGYAKGAFVYQVKKDGTRYAKPIFIEFVGSETTAEEIVARLKRLNPNSKYQLK